MIDCDTIDDFADALTRRSQPEAEAPQRENSETALARSVLDASLTRRTRAALKRGPGVFILAVPGTDWVPLMTEYMRSMERAPVVVPVTDLKKSGGLRLRAGRDELGLLGDRRSVMFITHDPDGLLDMASAASASASVGYLRSAWLLTLAPDGKSYTVMRDLVFGSGSAAAQFCCGSKGRGLAGWQPIDPDGGYDPDIPMLIVS